MTKMREDSDMANNRNWSQIGDDIEDIMRSVLESRDFKTLNETIAKTADQALENVGRTVQRGVDMARDKVRQGTEQTTYTYQKKTYETFGNRTTNYRTAEQNTYPAFEGRRASRAELVKSRFRNVTGRKNAGIALMACGFAFFGTLALGTGLVLPFTWAVEKAAAVFAGVVAAPFLAGTGWMAYKGTKMLNQTRRFHKYVEVLEDREFCQIKELATVTGKTESFVRKDLQQMIRKRFFFHGHLDKQQTCLMVTDNAYSQYQIAQKELENRQQEEKLRREEEAKMGKKEGLSKEAKEVIEAGKRYLTEIRESNDRIPGIEVSEKISRLELVIAKIFGRVEQHPELVDDLGRFMDYYLPTTVKLLRAYEELDAQPVQGTNIMNSKREIENTLDTIAKAFENLLDSFFEQAAWDISSDISVLQSMFAQEGLTESEFDKLKK